MRYVGNTALSPQIQERIQNTFQQTLGLAEEGNRQEALLGCDFILRLDPLFEPARRLQERLSEGEGPVDITHLDGDEVPPAPADEPAAPEEIIPEAPEGVIPEASVDIGELIADAPDEPPLVSEIPVEVAPPELDLPIEDAPVEAPIESSPIELITEDEPEIAATPSDELSLNVEPPPDAIELTDEPVVAELPTRMAMLLEQRNFHDLMALAMESQDQINAQPDLQRMVGLATERLEAEPYVRNFLDSAQGAKEKGDLDSARAHMEKARELDPSHPDLSALEADLEAASRIEPPASFEPRPIEPVTPVEETPPLIEHDSADEIAGEVDEFFASVETPATAEPAAAAPVVEAVAEPEPEPPISEPMAVPSLDAEPAARLDSESEQRIDDLLREGQDSFEGGQYQTAIDAWSRIFLIDIDHAEASRRIELARKLKAEVERQTEEAFHEGITRLESGDQDKATEAFNKVLEMQPNHMGARDYLDKIASGDLTAASVEVPELAPVDAEPAAKPVPAAPEDHEDLTPPPFPGPSELDEFEAPPPVVEDVPAPAPRKKSFALIGSAVLILVLAVGWFVYSNWNRFFPASGSEDVETTTPTQADPIERARELHEAGNTAMAINVLRRLPPSSEQHAEAQALIASWEANTQPAESTSEEPSEELLAQRLDLITQTEQAIGRGEHLLAIDLLNQANAIHELDDEHRVLREQATVALEYLREERDFFDQGDWEYALPNLWRMHDNNPDNPDVIRLMVDSYYNLGLRDLQRGDAKSAQEKLEEAQELTSDDAELNRLAKFSAAYAERPSDMLFRIFVKYQRFR